MESCETCKGDCAPEWRAKVKGGCVYHRPKYAIDGYVPVRCGEWTTDRVIVNKPVWSCSECTYQTFEKTPYCPMCGAKME